MTTAFAYRVRDALGKIHEGNLEAANEEAATQQLRQGGFQVLQIDEDDAAGGLFAKRISRSDIIYVTNQLAIMADTGITLSTAIGTLAEQQDNPNLKRVLGELKQMVEGGRDFSEALAKHPKLFDRTYVALVRASEATGTLPEMLDRIATYQRKEVETRSKVRAAMAYPAVMLFMAIAVTIFLLTFVMPKFTPLFSRQGASLPKPTIVMMAVSNGMINYWYVWLAVLVGAIGGFIWGRKTVTGRRWLDWVKIHAPLFGPMFRKVTISRGIRTLGTMISSGVPMLQEGIQLSAAVCGNYFYERLWRDAVQHVASGNRISEAIGRSPLFPRMLVQMISSGEETGKLDKVLEKVSNYYDQEVESSLKAVTSIIEPLLIAVMGVVVGGIAMALLLPIFSLSKMPG